MSHLIRPTPAPLAQRMPVVAPSALPASTQRSSWMRWPLAARIGFGIFIAVLGIVGLFAALLLTGQTEVIAWLVVGVVLTVVFGTPLLCLMGLLIFYAWVVMRAGRSRRLPRQPNPAPAPSPAQTVIVGEVVFGD